MVHVRPVRQALPQRLFGSRQMHLFHAPLPAGLLTTGIAVRGEQPSLVPTLEPKRLALHVSVLRAGLSRNPDGLTAAAFAELQHDAESTSTHEERGDT